MSQMLADAGRTDQGMQASHQLIGSSSEKQEVVMRHSDEGAHLCALSSRGQVQRAVQVADDGRGSASVDGRAQHAADDVDRHRQRHLLRQRVQHPGRIQLSPCSSTGAPSPSGDTANEALPITTSDAEQHFNH